MNAFFNRKSKNSNFYIAKEISFYIAQSIISIQAIMKTKYKIYQLSIAFPPIIYKRKKFLIAIVVSIYKYSHIILL